MNCHQALQIIDASPFHENRSARLETVQDHLADCKACRSALAAAEAIDAQLARLPEPPPPSSLAEVVRAHTAIHDPQQAAEPPAKPRTAPARSGTGRPAWAALLAGTTLGLGAQAYRFFMGEASLQLTGPLLNGGLNGLVEIPQHSPGLLFLGMALLIYAVGLLVPVRAR